MRTPQSRIVIGILVAVLLIGVGAVWYLRSDLYNEGKFNEYVATLTGEQQKLVKEMRAKVASIEPELKTATAPAPFVRAALEWKTIGEAIVAQDPRSKKYALRQALHYYELAIEKFGETNAMLFGSVGDVYKSLEEYEEAEKYYTQAIQLEPGNPLHYTKLAELYQYRLQKPPEEVLAVYARALDRLIYGGDAILRTRAVYYEELGRLREAALDWQKVLAYDPRNTAVKAEYDRLVRLLEERGETLEAPATATSTTPSVAK